MTNRDEIAVVGYASRLPGAVDVDAFWSLLRDNRSSVSWITPDRFSTQAFYHPTPDQIGRSYTFAAGVIEDVWGFDATAFGMSPREAEQVDPQQRHLLEVTHDALAHAGIRPSTLGGSGTGVYVGASSVDHAARFFADPSVADVHMMTGNSLSIMANRISYTLDVRGPSLAVDTACSSSLVALSLAADAIRSGAVDTAIVGGVNLLLSPFSYIGFSRASMLSPSGRCRPFDAAADGYVRAEGAIVVVLRSMAAARKARNRIHAVIVGSGVNQDGRTTGLALPSADSQRRLLEQVYGDFAVDPSDLTFLEAHGTGTRVGDPIEADALGKGLAQRRSQPLPIGSVKSNIGHLEPVSGLAGMLKAILALTHGMVPATLHQQNLNPDIPFDELNLRVIDRNWRPPERRGPSLAGVNSFGFGGTNAHVILRSDQAVVSMIHARSDEPPPPLLLTAHSADALRPLASAFAQQWPLDQRLLNEFIGASAHLRDSLPHRLIIRGGTAAEVKHHLDRFAQGDASPAALTGQAMGTDLPVTFLFSGNGSQWPGMGRSAWHSNARFREALRDIDEHFSKFQKWSLVDMLFAEDLAPRLRQATYSQPLLLALQIATVRALENFGVTPVATMGHSVGEIAAAWSAGVLSLEQAIEVVTARSRHQESVRNSGGMAALMLSDREARRLLKTANAPGVEVAAVNSWRSVTISGPTAEIDRVLAAASSAKISARPLDLDYPFHSPLVDPVREPLLRELEGLKPLELRKKFVSSVTGDFACREALGADHWWRNVREPVQFDASLNRLLKEGLRVFVEIGPKPILASYVRDILREADLRGVTLETLTESEGQQAADPLELAVSRVFLSGGAVDTHRFFGPPPATAISLPLYPWRHTQFQLQPTVDANTVLVATGHPLLGLRPRIDCAEWFSTIDPMVFPWLLDHKVGAVAVFPATGYVEVMLAAAKAVHGDGPLELRDLDILRPLVFDAAASFETSLRLSHETGIAEFLSRPRGGAADWTLNARGLINRAPTGGKARPAPLEPAGTVVVPKLKVYESATALGFDYGPSFQRVQQVAFPSSKCAIATLEPPVTDQGLAASVTDLTALDTAFHALMASEEGGVADMPMKRMLPVRFGCVRAFTPGATALRVVARTTRQSLTSHVMDIELFDESGALVLSADSVRLIEAPTELAVDPQSLSYRTTARVLDRPGSTSPVSLSPIDGPQPAPPAATPPPALLEALLLVEAGCLRAAWAALSNPGARDLRHRPSPTSDVDNSADWSIFLRAALLWHLESKNLAVERDGIRALTPTCDLPEIGPIVSSLVVRHPAMAEEAASLSHIEKILGRMISGDPTAAVEFGAGHGRHLSAAYGQTSALREAVVAHVAEAIAQCAGNQLLRLLMIGADRAVIASDLTARFPNLELIVTDLDTDRLEQARAVLGDDAPQIHCIPWTELDDLSAGALDLAFAIDALSEVAAVRGGLDRIARLLRPGAPLVAGELAPSIFWDMVRGVRPSWWARSANTDFPVGALLTAKEWTDELLVAGFASAMAAPVGGEARIGVILHGVAGNTFGKADEALASGCPTFAWKGDDTPRSSGLLAILARRIDEQTGVNASLAGRAASTGDRPPAASDAPAVTDIAWLIDAQDVAADPARLLSRHLSQIADHCRHFAEAPARLWIVMDFGGAASDESALDRPLWCAITAAMRVAQNEYSGLQVRCVGLAAAAQSRAVERAVEEMLAPGDEREVFFGDDRRFVFRVERGSATPAALQPMADDELLRLTSRHGGTRGALVWVSDVRPEPGPDEIEIRVATTGLNFRDVMWNLRLLPEEALEDGYAGAGFGMECAGTVARVGAAVDGLAVGDRVVAFVPGAFASHVVAPAFAVSLLPRQLTFEAATTLPVAFLTAYYSLVHLGRLSRGETVLIHGGAGAVGLAALQISRHRGARVLATAGTEEKRALLRNVGATFVCNSRTLAFADEIAAYTDGRGVDVVLNSLAGEAMTRSMDCLKPFGRFIELGKRDFYANTHLGLRPFRKNLTYFGVDVDQLLGENSELARRLFSEVVQLFADGQLVPLPYRVCSGDHIGDAFRLMQRSGHIGKIIVTPAVHGTDSGRASGQFPVATAGVHVVIGGTGGFGLATAEWLVERGATHLALASRSGALSAPSSAKVEALRARGVEVEIAAVDVTDEAALELFLHQAASSRPIKGIVHAAMVLDDRLIDGLDHESIELVLRPKILGALHLERLSRGLALDYLLLFSSATTLFGNPGQFNYVAANAFLDGLARQMRSRGRPALSVAWGGIEDAGYLSRHIGENVNLKKRFASSLISARTALDGLDWAYDRQGRQKTGAYAIARIDWAMAKRELAATRAPTFAAVGAATGTRQGVDATATLEKLRGMPAEEATAALLDIIVDEIARVLRLPPKEIDRHRPLAEIGMDSLMMLELRTTVETSLQVELPMMSLASGITPADVARRIAPLVTGEVQKEALPGTLVALSASHFATDAEATTAVDQRSAVGAVLRRVRELEGPL